MTAPHASDAGLCRFVEAQEPVYDRVLTELRSGRKSTHWMWFIFPQLKALGRSATAAHFGIVSLREAQAYLDHPLLGVRLRECTSLVNAVPGRAIREILGFPDDLKFRSSMTLFAQATGDNQVFLDALEKYYGSRPDPITIELLGR